MRCHRFYFLVWSTRPFILMTPLSPLPALIATGNARHRCQLCARAFTSREGVECFTFTVSPPGNNSLFAPFSFITSLTSRPPFSQVVRYSEALRSVIIFASLRPSDHSAAMWSFLISNGWHHPCGWKKKCSLSRSYLSFYAFNCAGVNRWFMEVALQLHPCCYMLSELNRCVSVCSILPTGGQGVWSVYKGTSEHAAYEPGGHDLNLGCNLVLSSSICHPVPTSTGAVAGAVSPLEEVWQRVEVDWD